MPRGEGRYGQIIGADPIQRAVFLIGVTRYDPADVAAMLTRHFDHLSPTQILSAVAQAEAHLEISDVFQRQGRDRRLGVNRMLHDPDQAAPFRFVMEVCYVDQDTGQWQYRMLVQESDRNLTRGELEVASRDFIQERRGDDRYRGLRADKESWEQWCGTRLVSASRKA